MKSIIISLAVLFFSGCVAKQIPPKVEYKINTKASITAKSAKGCQEKTLQISKAFAPNYLMRKQMSYVEDEFIQNVYSASQWSVTPSNAISMELLQALGDTQLFKSVQSNKSRSKNDYILEMHIEDFLQYFHKESSSSYVNAKIALTLLDFRGNIIASETFTQKIQTQQLNAQGGVKALNEALKLIILDSVAWLEKGCQ